MKKKIVSILKEIELALSDGLTLQANNSACWLIEDYPEDVRLLQLYGLSLARLGATETAREYLERAYTLDSKSGETLGILARVYKDGYKSTGNLEMALLSRDTYLKGYRVSADYYPGINAAAMSMVVGEEAVAHKIAGEIIRELSESAESYWEFATLGEAHLLKGNTKTSEAYYLKAVDAAVGRIGDVNSSYLQLRFLADFIEVPESLIELLAPPGIVAFSGHMIDTPDRVEPRFPESSAAAVKKRLGEILDAENIGIGYCSAACGADILFIEALLERNGEVNVILPFKDDDFLETSVSFAGEHWVRRFRTVIDRVAVSRITAEGYFGGDDIYRFLGKIIMGKTLLRGTELSSSPLLMTVLAPESEALIGGARDVEEQWPFPERRLNIDPTELIPAERVTLHRTAEVIDLSSERKTGRILPPDIQHTMKCILFADIVGYSRLQEEQTPFFMYEVLHAISEKFAALDRRPEILNTWGDAIFVVYESSSDLMLIAKLLRDIFVGTDWKVKGLPEHLNIRIALHAGPVFIANDPVRNEINGYGSHINRTARIEPITLPGCIYASAQFAALLKIETGETYRYEYVGRLELPKESGLQDVYHICC